MSHPIIHIDFEGEDPRVLSQFYSQLFGWKVRTDEASNYTMFEAAGGPDGGFVPRTGGNSIIPFIATDDIEATLASAVALGGRVLVAAQKMPDGSAWAVFTDPEGSKVGLLGKYEVSDRIEKAPA